MAHITVVTQRAGRRINSTRGTRVNLCGAAATDRDILVRHARRMNATEDVRFNVCDACRAKLTATIQRMEAR